MIRLVIPGLKLESTANKRWHWSKLAKYKKMVRAHVLAAIAEAGLWHAKPPAGRVAVTITRIGPRALDVDNLYASLKCALDALKGRLIEDDDEGHLELRARQRKGKYAVEIEVA